ncbi:hypothetical protein JSE7799_03043 [Jannaschia seosinensis]|uniref:Integral membrane protein n=1 Tax=Jannaschia seosinensis TaxID=313367 RepID=A0A0M7BD40_9RHOB|nr:hypothetical protein [Jannaschia seosinensis]CUH40311.1 hypothetical protein JSE7799_03043 [Jannaschia seosinensis]
MRLIPLVLALMAAAPAFAQRAVTPDEFDTMVTGRTLHFNRAGEPFGAEQYFEDKRVIWSFENGQCQRGIWFTNAEDEICFVYEGDPASQCWNFLEMPGGDLHARLPGSDPAGDLVMRDVSREALNCPLPDLGV